MSGALRRVAVSTLMVARDLARNRVAVALLLVVPTAFYLLIHVTTGGRAIPFRLAATGDLLYFANERHLSLLFIGMAAISGLSAFLSFVLVLRTAAADRRLVFEGYRPWELLAAKVAVVGGATLLVAAYVTVLLPLFFAPGRLAGVFVAFFLTSLVYGALGMTVGAVVRRELEGMLIIILLVNVDAGWLQNPAIYADARNQALIRMLPGHHPGQVAMLSAFTDAGLGGEVWASLGYAAGGLAIAAALYWLRVRTVR